VSSIEDVGKTKRKIILEIPAEEIKPHLDEAVNSLSGKMKLKGFRQGKIPRGVLMTQFAANIRSHLSENYLSEKLHDEIKTHGLTPASILRIEALQFADGQPATVEASFDIFHEFELPDLSGVELNKYNVYVTDEEIDFQIKHLQRSQATVRTEDEDREIRKGDQADISYEIICKGKPVPSRKGDNANITLEAGSEEPNGRPGLSQEILGLKKGGSKDISISLSDSYPNRSLAGKKAILRLTINNIRVLELPEIDDDFAKDLGLPEVTDLESLRKYLKDTIFSDREERFLENLRYNLISKIIQKIDLELPDAAVISETVRLLDMYNKDQIQKGEEPLDLTLPQNKQFLAEFQSKAARRLKSNLIHDKVVKTQSIEVTDEEMAEKFKNYAYVTGQPLDSIQKFYSKDSRQYQTALYQVEYSKVMDYLCSLIKVNECDLPPNIPEVQEDTASRLLRDLEAGSSEDSGDENLSPDSGPANVTLDSGDGSLSPDSPAPDSGAENQDAGRGGPEDQPDI
jgi:trigger factor